MSVPNRTSDDLQRVVSHGRGGAGNIAEDNGPEDEVGLPYLTSQMYTTGRGGNGNMAFNDPEHPEKARTAQDVEMYPSAPSANDYYGGRGGAGNTYNAEEEEAKAAKIRAEEAKKTKLPPVDHSKIDYRGWADKGKDLLFRRSKNHR